MFAGRVSSVPSPAGPSGQIVRRQRADARVALAAERIGDRTVVTRVAESGSARIRFPTVAGGVPEGVLINTGGGIAGGDRFCTEAAIGPGASLVLTSAAAEKAYRSHGDTAWVEARMSLAAGARFHWIPQETILFERVRLHRSLDVSMDEGATALLAEALVFGRAAAGERITDGVLEDRWRVRRAGRLVYADTLRLHGPVSDLLARPALGGGARAAATLLYVAPDAESRLDEARGLIDNAVSECGASAWNGMLALRFLGRTIEGLRADLARVLVGLGGRPLPRNWIL